MFSAATKSKRLTIPDSASAQSRGVVRNALIDSHQHFPASFPQVHAFFRFLLGPVGAFQSRFFGAQELWRVYRFPGRKKSEGFQTDIDPDQLFGLGQRLGFQLAGDSGKPFGCSCIHRISYH